MQKRASAINDNDRDDRYIKMDFEFAVSKTIQVGLKHEICRERLSKLIKWKLMILNNWNTSIVCTNTMRLMIAWFRSNSIHMYSTLWATIMFSTTKKQKSMDLLNIKTLVLVL